MRRRLRLCNRLRKSSSNTDEGNKDGEELHVN